MANYNETTATGVSWQRCHRVTVENSLDSTPSVLMFEEEVVEINNKRYNTLLGLIQKPFDPVNGVIQLRNPETGELTGTSVSHLELYTILYSLYIQSALERDSNAPPV